MARIVYLVFSEGGMQGGHKMAFRHVETLRDLGFDAICYIGAGGKVPQWFAQDAPIMIGGRLRPDDIVVIPEDARGALAYSTERKFKSAIFIQNLYYFMGKTQKELDRLPKDGFPPFLCVGPRLRADVARLYPHAKVELVPCFADERVFKAGQPKDGAIAFAPRKRPLEANVIVHLFRRFHTRHDARPMRVIEGMTEAQAAMVFARSALCLSLNRLEGVGMTTLEAMASGCLCAGFTGVGGDDYATAENGFWVPNEDCVAAADALAEAADLVSTGGSALKARLEGGYEAARTWSYAAFKVALEETWMRLAPEARVSGGSLAS